MTSAFAFDDRERLLRWLHQGASLVQEKQGGVAPTHSDVIWALIQNAALVMERTPDQERRWLTSGYRSGGWNSVGLTYAEARQLEQLRCHAAMSPYDSQTRSPQTAHEHDRAYDVLSFLRWCGVYVRTRKVVEMRKAAVVLARKGDCEEFRKVWLRGRRGEMTRQAVSKFRQVLAGHIMAGLRHDCGIVPVQGTCEFA